MEQPGLYRGRHYTEYPDQVRSLKRAGRLEEAERLLLGLIDAVEAESRAERLGVAPWYYEQLAIVYRKQKNRVREQEILERFARQRHAAGVKPAKLLQRLRAITGDLDKEARRSTREGRSKGQATARSEPKRSAPDTVPPVAADQDRTTPGQSPGCLIVVLVVVGLLTSLCSSPSRHRGESGYGSRDSDHAERPAEVAAVSCGVLPVVSADLMQAASR